MPYGTAVWLKHAEHFLLLFVSGTVVQCRFSKWVLLLILAYRSNLTDVKKWFILRMRNAIFRF
jgi:hypothetical protein